MFLKRNYYTHLISNHRSSLLRQSVSRINIHRSKKLNAVAKKKDDIAKHLEAGNEVNALIWVLSEIFVHR